ncbi:IS30 family transposase [Escherichia coli]|nr:IS30 family transposase [Escherichia coli]
MRRTFTAEEKASVFELWKNGTGFSEIANILGSKPGTIFTMLRDTGGIKPHEHKRAVAHLTLSEREEIRAGLSAKMSIRAIATALNRSPSTISREVQRNRGRRYYKAVDANNRANRMAKRPKPCLLDQNLPLRKLVLEKLEMKWSPEQISGWLRRTKPRQKTLRISPETIYKTLYFRSREALHHLNIQHLRRSHSLRHGRRHTRKGERGTINIVNGTPIHERSRNIDNRRSLGHWEGDLVSGTKNSHIATLVDRKSRYTIILRLRGKDSVSVNQVAKFSKPLHHFRADETKRMVDASAQPHIVVTLEPNPWAAFYFEINIANTGNAPAYNVEVVFDPPLVNAEHREKSEIPFSKVSVLKNGQSLTSNLCKYEQIKDQIYNINISWASKPKSNDRETNEYVYDMATFEGISYLGARSPLTQIAEQIKGIREDWKPIAQGAKKVKADVYTSSDRNEERTYLQEQHDLAIKRRDEKREKRLESGE